MLVFALAAVVLVVAAEGLQGDRESNTQQGSSGLDFCIPRSRSQNNWAIPLYKATPPPLMTQDHPRPWDGQK